VARQRDFIKAVLEIKVTKIGRGRWHDKRAGITITQRSPLHNTIIQRCY
jgi:site-specific DNA recombinase